MSELVVVLAADQFRPSYDAADAIAEIWCGTGGPYTCNVAANHPHEAQAITIRGDFGPHPHLSVWFKNDRYGGQPGMDRNLYLLGATLDGVWFAPPANAAMFDGSQGVGMELYSVATPVVVVAPRAPAVPTFVDDFSADTPDRWVNFDGRTWPPTAATSGTWARCYMQGWPSNTGSQDDAARSLARNHEQQCYEDRGVSIGPDGLVLTATRDANNHHALPFTSGCIAQHPKLAMQYGYFSARMRLPFGRGLWPAFWLLAADGVWPPELDVMEMVGTDQAGNATNVCFRSGVGGGSGNWPRCDSLDKWHDFGVLWTPETITFTLDGQITASQPTPANAHRPMYMLADLAIGGSGSWPGEPPATLTKATMGVRRMASYALGSWGPGQFPVIG